MYLIIEIEVGTSITESQKWPRFYQISTTHPSHLCKTANLCDQTVMQKGSTRQNIKKRFSNLICNPNLSTSSYLKKILLGNNLC